MELVGGGQREKMWTTVITDNKNIKILKTESVRGKESIYFAKQVVCVLYIIINYSVLKKL